MYLNPHVDKDTATPIVTRDLGGSHIFALHLRREWFCSMEHWGDPDSDDAPVIGTYLDLQFKEAWKVYGMGTPEANLADYTYAKDGAKTFAAD